MGYYINTDSQNRDLPHRGKAQFLINDGAKQIPKPDKFIPNLVCIVDNSLFEAAAYIYSERELEDFANINDSRPKTWLIYEHAANLSGY